MLNAIKQHFTTRKSISFIHIWNIENYIQLYNESHSWNWKICSDCFSPPNNKQFELAFYLYPKGYAETWKDYVSIGLNVYGMSQISEGKIKCRWKVAIKDENGVKCATKRTKIYCLFSSEETMLPDYIKYSSLLNSPSKYLPQSKLTLHFEIHLQADEPIFNVITNNEVSSSRFDCANKVTKVAHTWTIKNFANLYNSNEAAPFFLQSPNFPVSSEQGDGFCLRLYPNGWSKEKGKKYLDISIQNDNENSATVHRRTSILDADGEKCYTTEWTRKINSKNGTKFRLSRDSILEISNGFVVDNKLRIHCEMIYMMDNKTNFNHLKICDTIYKSKSITDVTHQAIHYVSHQWTIDKFSALCLNSPKNHSIDSQIFNPPTDLRFAFHLRLFPNGHVEHNKKYVSLDLLNVSHNFNQVTVQYRISILGANGVNWIRWGNQSTLSKNESVSLLNFIPQSALQTPSQIKQYLLNDKLTIICEIWVIQNRKSISKSNLSHSSSHQITSTFAPSIHVSNIHGSYILVNSNSHIDGPVVLKSVSVTKTN